MGTIKYIKETLVSARVCSRKRKNYFRNFCLKYSRSTHKARLIGPIYCAITEIVPYKCQASKTDRLQLRVSEAHWFASLRNRSVRGSFKPPRAQRLRLVTLISILIEMHSNFVQYTPRKIGIFFCPFLLISNFCGSGQMR